MFPGAPEPWLDLSTGLSPFAYPVANIPSEAWTRLPPADAVFDLERRAADSYGCGPDMAIVATPGTQAAIQWLPFLVERCRVAVVAPTYAEHAACWRRAGHDVATVDDALQPDADVVILVNPNNPTGHTLCATQVLDLREKLSARGAWLVVDEAFADVDPSCSVAKHAGDGLLVLRSFGKFFGLAGVRLGFLLGDPTVVGRLRAALGVWAVSGPAIAVARQALADGAWQEQARHRLRVRRRMLDETLHRAGLTVCGGTDLFRLAQSARADDVFERLGRQGVLVRRFPTQACWLRFGVCGTEAELERLSSALG